MGTVCQKRVPKRNTAARDVSERDGHQYLVHAAVEHPLLGGDPGREQVINSVGAAPSRSRPGPFRDDSCSGLAASSGVLKG